MGRAGWNRLLDRATVGRLVRPATLLVLVAALAAGAGFAALLVRREAPRQRAANARMSASSQLPVLSGLETAFAGLRREATATACSNETQPGSRCADAITL
jgi:hypothetical protein